MRALGSALRAVAVFACVTLFVPSAHSAPASLDETLVAYDRELQAQLEAKDPEAARLFEQANEARDARDFALASKLYDDVTRRLPYFDAALRRRCGVESELHSRAAAIDLCRRAVGLARSKENLAALSFALSASGSGPDRPSPAQMVEAAAVADEALRIAPNDPFALMVVCQVALQSTNVDRLEVCSAALRSVEPNDFRSWFFSAIAALGSGRLEDADVAIARCESLAAPKEAIAELRRLRDEVQRQPKPVLPRLWAILWRTMVGWFAVFALLFFVGRVFSNATVRTARTEAAMMKEPTAGERWLRRCYRIVIALCCVYYYLSIPLVVLSVIAGALGVLYVCLVLGYLPVGGLVLVGIFALWTIGTLVRNAFVRGRKVSPGERLDRAAHPRLDAALKEVAGRIGTHVVDAVYLSPATELAVTERGGMFQRLRGKTERALILGVGVLDGMTVRELKSILAHEYGHFRNEDTAGGGLALAVSRSLVVTTIRLAQGGVASALNPGWLFVRGFLKLFLRISQGASRLQEVLADRWAVHAYGSVPFARGLRHVVTASVRFDAHIDATVEEVVRAESSLGNLYQYVPSSPSREEDLSEKIEGAMTKVTPYDGHPSPEARITLAEKLALEGSPLAEGEDESAWTLFSDRALVEESMTAVIRERLAAGGVRVSAA